MPYRQCPTQRPAVRRCISKFLTLTLVLLGLALALPAAAAASGGGWNVQSSGTTNYFTGVAFPDVTHGWAVGEFGNILATTDGGTTWTAQSSGLGSYSYLYSVAFANASDGWAVGYRGPPDSLTVTSIILATTDGGDTWSPQGSGTTDFGLESVACADATHAWAVGDAILATTDGGATWNVQAPGTPQGTADVLTGVTCADASHAWAVGCDERTGVGIILTTTDGGVTWSCQSANEAAGSLTAVTCADATHVWAVGDLILASTDGGVTWQAQPTGAYADDLHSVAFANALDGWAGGQDRDTLASVILATVDGGATWSTQSADTTDMLYSIACADATHAWAVGYDPWAVMGGATGSDIILSTSTGGYSAPTLTVFLPTSGAVGSSVALTGTNFSGASKVAFNGVAAKFTTDSDTQISATVPASATTGPIAVTTPGGTATSATDFTVIPAPKITSFAPPSGPVGTAVTLTGTNFAGATAVDFHGLAASFTVNSATQISATVPASATTGPIAVTTPGGTATSATSFTVMVTPKLTLKLSGLKSGALKLGKRLTAKGSVTPTSLAGSKVTLAVQRKRGGKWRKVTSLARTISASGAYSWKYKPTKKGSYRIQATIARAAANTAAETTWRTFKVK